MHHLILPQLKPNYTQTRQIGVKYAYMEKLSNNNRRAQLELLQPMEFMHTSEFQNFDHVTQRLARTAIVHGFINNVRTLLDEKKRKRFVKIGKTGVHELSHRMGVINAGWQDLGVEVNEDGSGVTKYRASFVRSARSLREYIEKRMYISFLGKAGEEALGAVPYGHGSDMSQVKSLDKAAQGSVSVSAAESRANADAASNIGYLTYEGLKYFKEAA